MNQWHVKAVITQDGTGRQLDTYIGFRAVDENDARAKAERYLKRNAGDAWRIVGISRKKKPCRSS